MTERLRNAAAWVLRLPSYVLVPAALATSGACFLLSAEMVAPGTVALFAAQTGAVWSSLRGAILANPLSAGLAVVLAATVSAAVAVIWTDRDNEAQP